MVIVYLATDFPNGKSVAALPITNFIQTVVAHSKIESKLMTLSEKYPEEYFDHWIGMLFTIDSDLTESGIKEQIEMYKSFEGKEEFIALQLELKTIINNGDLEQFLKLADENGKIQLDEFERMSELILSE